MNKVKCDQRWWLNLSRKQIKFVHKEQSMRIWTVTESLCEERNSVTAAGDDDGVRSSHQQTWKMVGRTPKILYGGEKPTNTLEMGIMMPTQHAWYLLMINWEFNDLWPLEIDILAFPNKYISKLNKIWRLTWPELQPAAMKFGCLSQ